MTITICIGSSCYLKNSKEIVAILERLIALHHLQEQVELVGSFCLGHCTEGVCVKIGEELFSLSPATTEAFFQKEVLGRLSA